MNNKDSENKSSGFALNDIVKRKILSLYGIAKKNEPPSSDTNKSSETQNSLQENKSQNSN